MDGMRSPLHNYSRVSPGNFPPIKDKNNFRGGFEKNRRVGNYTLGEVIGTGQFSKVRVAFDLRTKKQYAMKILSLKNLKKENMEQQLRKEVAIMRIVNHPYIVKLEKVLQTKRNIYILMEHVTSGDLFRKIAKEKKFYLMNFLFLLKSSF